MSNEPNVAVTILNYNGKEHLQECLTSVCELDYPSYDVIVVDNNSTDESVEYIQSEFPGIELIQHEKNYAFAEGYNRAIESLEHEFIALLNNDTVVEPSWLSELVISIQRDSDIAAVSSKIRLYNNPEYIQHAGGAITPMGGGIDIGVHRSMFTAPNKRRETGYGCGAALMLRRSAFEAINGFDTRHKFYYEDVDLCWRLWLCGYNVIWEPNSVVFHKWGGSWDNQSSPEITYHKEKNKLINSIKNFGLRRLLSAIVLGILYQIYIIARSPVRGNWGIIVAIVRADLYILQEMRSLLRDRRSIQSNRSRTDESLRNCGCFASMKDLIDQFCRLNK